MPQTIHVSDQLFARLQAHAVAFVDQPEDVIKRLLDWYEQGPDGATADKAPSPPRHPRQADVGKVAERTPRQRGVRVQIGGEVLSAASIADLYEQALTILLDKVDSTRFATLIPSSTSKERYLIAKKPVHPNGTDFVRPIQRRGFYMETHKDYRNAISHLGGFVEKCGLSFRYLGS